MGISEKELKAMIHLRAHIAHVLSSNHKNHSEEEIHALSKVYASEAPAHLHEVLGEAKIIRAFEKELKKMLKGNKLAQQAKKIPEFMFKVGGALIYRGDENGLVLSLKTLREQRDNISEEIDDLNTKLYEVDDPDSDSRFPEFVLQGKEREMVLHRVAKLQQQYNAKRSEMREHLRIRRQLGAQYGLVIKKDIAKSILHGKQLVDDRRRAVNKLIGGNSKASDKHNPDDNRVKRGKH